MNTGYEDFCEELDAAICEHIATKVIHPIYAARLIALAAQELRVGNVPIVEGAARRLIDRRVQTMRKAGRLMYERTKGGDHGRWRVVGAVGWPVD